MSGRREGGQGGQRSVGGVGALWSPQFLVRAVSRERRLCRLL